MALNPMFEWTTDKFKQALDASKQLLTRNKEITDDSPSLSKWTASDSTRVLIVYTGSSAASAAAVEASLRKHANDSNKDMAITCIDLWANAPFPFNNVGQDSSRSGFVSRALFETSRLETRRLFIEAAYRQNRNTFIQQISAASPDIVVSVHPMCQEVVSRVLDDVTFLWAEQIKKEAPSIKGPPALIPLVTIVSELGDNPHPLWFSPLTTLTLVPSLAVYKLAAEKYKMNRRVAILGGLVLDPVFSQESATGARGAVWRMLSEEGQKQAVALKKFRPVGENQETDAAVISLADSIDRTLQACLTTSRALDHFSRPSSPPLVTGLEKIKETDEADLWIADHSDNLLTLLEDTHCTLKSELGLRPDLPLVVVVGARDGKLLTSLDEVLSKVMEELLKVLNVPRTVVTTPPVEAITETTEQSQSYFGRWFFPVAAPVVNNARSAASNLRARLFAPSDDKLTGPLVNEAGITKVQVLLILQSKRILPSPPPPPCAPSGSQVEAAAYDSRSTAAAPGYASKPTEFAEQSPKSALSGVPNALQTLRSQLTQSQPIAGDQQSASTVQGQLVASIDKLRSIKAVIERKHHSAVVAANNLLAGSSRGGRSHASSFASASPKHGLSPKSHRTELFLIDDAEAGIVASLGAREEAKSFPAPPMEKEEEEEHSVSNAAPAHSGNASPVRGGGVSRDLAEIPEGEEEEEDKEVEEKEEGEEVISEQQAATLAKAQTAIQSLWGGVVSWAEEKAVPVVKKGLTTAVHETNKLIATAVKTESVKPEVVERRRLRHEALQTRVRITAPSKVHLRVLELDGAEKSTYATALRAADVVVCEPSSHMVAEVAACGSVAVLSGSAAAGDASSVAFATRRMALQREGCAELAQDVARLLVTYEGTEVRKGLALGAVRNAQPLAGGLLGLMLEGEPLNEDLLDAQERLQSRQAAVVKPEVPPVVDIELVDKNSVGAGDMSDGESQTDHDDATKSVSHLHVDPLSGKVAEGAESDAFRSARESVVSPAIENS